MSDKNIPPHGKPAAKKLSPFLKFALEMGPLLLFLAVYGRFDIITATGVLMAAVVAALIITYILTRHIPVMPLVTGAIVLVMGGLTLAFNNPIFIKMKATFVYALFGAALLGGLAFGKALLPIALDSVLQLDEAGWKKLTLRWGIFFFCLAALNEVVWRNYSEEIWVKFKVFGFVPLTIIFALAQTPLILRHELKGADAKAAPEHF